MKKTKYEITDLKGDIHSYYDAEINHTHNGTLVVTHGTGTETWWPPGQWSLMAVSHYAAADAPVSSEDVGAWWNDPGPYVGQIVSYVGSGNPMVEVEGVQKQFSCDNIEGELDGPHVLVTINSKEPPIIRALASKEEFAGQKPWWEITGVHDGVYLGVNTGKVVVQVDNAPCTFDLTSIPEGERLKIGEEVICVVGVSGNVSIRRAEK